MSELESTEIQVIQNSDRLFVKSFDVVKNIEPQEINEYERNMLKGSKDVTTLLKEEQEEKEQKLTEEEKEKQKRKAYIDMIKVIALDRMGLFVLTNPSTLPKTKKDKVQETMYSIMEELAEEELRKEFNRVCQEKLFDTSIDYSQFPIYK